MIRLGIIGAGRHAAKHVAALAALGGRARLVYAARRDLTRAFPEAGAMGARLVAPDALLASPQVDAVIVCSPNHLHRPQVEAALRAGKHVLCEKPLALTIEDADALIALARESPGTLVVGHVTRHTPLYAAVVRVLKDGRLGAPVAAYASRLHSGAGRAWRMNPRTGGGVAFDLLVHDFDLLNWYLGPPSAVVARGRRHAQGAYDHLAATFTYPGGAVALAEGSFLLREPARLSARLHVVCEDGHLEVDPGHREAPLRVFPEGASEEPVEIDDAGPSGLAGELTEFLDVIQGKPMRHQHLEDARLAVQCAVLAIHAATTGKEARFP